MLVFTFLNFFSVCLFVFVLLFYRVLLLLQNKMESMETEGLLILKDHKTASDVVHEYSPAIKYGHVPLVIDNGKTKS